MQIPNIVKIHEFELSGAPFFDDDGDQMIGFYFQFMDGDNGPISGLVGPYPDKATVEAAALKAFKQKDF